MTIALVMAALAAWAAAVVKARDAKRAGSRGLWLLALALVFMGGAFAVGGHALDEYVPAIVLNVRQFVFHAFVVASVAAFQLCFLYLTADPRAQRGRVHWHVAATIITGLGLTVAAVVVLSRAWSTPAALDQTSATHPDVLVYHLIYLAGLTYIMTDLAVILGRAARRVQHRWTATGLALVSGGFALFLINTGLKAAIVIAVATRTTLPPLWNTIAIGAIILGCLIATAGLTITRWAQPAHRRWTTVQDRRRYRALRPLWTAMRTRFPAIALPGILTEDARPAELTYHLTRAIVEIRDGYIQLRPWWPAPPPDSGTRRSRRRRAHREAHTLHTALLASQHTAPPAGASGTDRDDAGVAAPLSVHDEIVWLARVSTAFRPLAITREGSSA